MEIPFKEGRIMYNRTYTGKNRISRTGYCRRHSVMALEIENSDEDDLRGCKAPVVPFYEALQQFGIECDWDEIRKPMGNFKPTHLRMLLNLPENFLTVGRKVRTSLERR